VLYGRDEYTALLKGHDVYALGSEPEFDERFLPLVIELILGVSGLLSASLSFTEADLKTYTTKELATKLKNNPLKRTFQCLGFILIQQSKEARERESERAKAEREARVARKLATTNSTTQPGIPSPPIRQPSTFPTTPQKRNISDTSFGARSAETTPTKLVKPEAEIQRLQSTLVDDILEALYDQSFIEVEWAEGRELTIQYTS
jgi:hypothetical protein